MKMNWGNSIVIVFVLFATFILYMVVRAFQEDFDLVTEDYYAQELNYQDKLEQKSNWEQLVTKVKVSLADDQIKLTFPEDHTPSGEIQFYHPSHKALDRTFTIQTNQVNAQIMSQEELIKGQYRINITWKSEGVEYFQQEKIYIQ
jgi:hypothetical protein